LHQASSALQPSTSFVSPAQSTRQVAHQANSALQSSASFSSQTAEVPLLVQPQPVTAQLAQVVRPFISDFAEPVAPTLSLHAPPQQPEPEYDLVTVTKQGYEVRHID